MRSRTTLALELPSDVRSIERAVERVVRRCTRCGVDRRRLRLNLRVGLLEALSNAVVYGNGEDPAKRVTLEVTVHERTITAVITDEGLGFDPDAVADPTTPANITRSGGRGIYLMRSLCDEVHFNDQGNSVTLVLFRDRAAAQDVAESA